MKNTIVLRSSLFGSLTFYKKALSIALPVMAQLLIQNLVSLIDNFMVAGLGDVKMAGVNIAGQISFMFMIFVGTLCLAGGIFMSQYLGAKDEYGMKQAFRFKLIMTSIAGIAFTSLCFFSSRPILSLMVRGNAQSGVILDQGVLYMSVLAFSWLPMCISTSIASSLRELGIVRPPLIISIISTLVNTFFNWILIYGNLGAPRLEVTGAALATIIARCVEMIIFIGFIIRCKPPFYVRITKILQVRLGLFVSILRKSGLMLVSEMIWVSSETVLVALYNSRGGAEIVSGMAASFAIANLFFVSFSGIHTSTGVIIGSTLGAGRLEEARRQKSWMIHGAGVFGILAGIAGCFSVLLIPLVFSNLSEASRTVTRQMVFIISGFMPAWCYVNAQFAVSRTGGDTTMGVLVDVVTTIFLVIPGMFMMTYLTDFGPVLMFFMIKLVDFVKIGIATFWLRKEFWVRNLTIQ